MSFLVPLSIGAYYLIFAIIQTGDPSYGVYSGTTTINGDTYKFSSLDGTNTVRIDFTV
jgi:hypothetical protein